MTYLPWAGSLESDSADTSPDSPAHPDRPIIPDSHADPAGRDGPGTSAGPPSLPRPANPNGLGGRSRAGSHPDSGAPGQAAALGQAISNRLFSVGLDLHFVMMTRHEGPGVPRLEHAIAEIDDAIKDLRHLMVAITQRLA
jgi:hypothetical protein